MIWICAVVTSTGDVSHVATLRISAELEGAVYLPAQCLPVVSMSRARIASKQAANPWQKESPFGQATKRGLDNWPGFLNSTGRLKAQNTAPSKMHGAHRALTPMQGRK